MGIESQWARDFLHTSIAVLGLNQPPTQWVTSLFTGGKAARRGVDNPPPFTAEVKVRVEI
jgi:hypothetical protein